MTSSALQLVASQSPMARVKAGSRQMQVRFDRLLQEVGAWRPMGTHFWEQGGQLARSVGSPAVLVAVTAMADMAMSEKADIEGIMVVRKWLLLL